MNIEHGEKLFEFRSKQDWINKAQRIWRLHEVRAEHTVCVDQLGRICGWGKHFADAERDNAYPIEVFRLRQDMTPNDIVERPGAASGDRSARTTGCASNGTNNERTDK